MSEKQKKESSPLKYSHLLKSAMQGLILLCNRRLIKGNSFLFSTSISYLDAKALTSDADQILKLQCINSMFGYWQGQIQDWMTSRANM